MLEVSRATFKSVEVMKDGKVIRLNVGDRIEFANLTAEVKKGTIVNLGGTKAEKVSITIQPDDEECEVTWKVASIAENSLRLVSEE